MDMRKMALVAMLTSVACLWYARAAEAPILSSAELIRNGIYRLAVESYHVPLEKAMTLAQSIADTAAEYELDPVWVASIIAVESWFHVRALSPCGARGLMQLMPATARGLGVMDSYDPVQNVRGGCAYLAEQLRRFGTPMLAMAAYNAGPGAVRKYGGVPPYRETRWYLCQVTQVQMRLAEGMAS